MTDPMRAAWAQHNFADDVADLTAPTTLIHAALRHWKADPQRVAFIRTDGTKVTNGELHQLVEHAAQRLIASGINVGDMVLMSCTPSVELVVAHIAVLMVGAVAVPVNTGFTAVELVNIASEANVALAILSDHSRWARSQGSVKVVSPTLHDLDTSAYDSPDDAAIVDRLAELTVDSPALLLFTSGTTGRPKGALLSHGNILASAAALLHAWQWTSDDRLVLCLPLFHMHGLGVGVHGTLLAGASAIILPSFTEADVFDAAAKYEATLLFGVPTMWTRLVDHDRVGELARLRLCVSGSAPLSPQVWNALHDRAGQSIVERYGMTETVMLTSNPLNGSRKAGTVGLPLPGVEVQLDDPGADEVGEIVVRGPNVFAGYLDRPDANAEAFLPGNWFRTGDLGRFDADGFLSIVGRSKDLIITGGYNVYPVDVEAIMRNHAEVAEVAIIGEPSELWGETVTACVVLRADATATADSLIAFSAEHLAPYQRPRKVVLLDTLPRNALGKVVKAELTKLLK